MVKAISESLQNLHEGELTKIFTYIYSILLLVKERHCTTGVTKKMTIRVQNLHEGGRGAGKLPRAFIDRFISCIEVGIREEEATVPEGPPKLRLAVQHQNKIGTSKLLQCYLAISWVEALKEFGCKRVNTKISWLLRQLWETVFLQQWDTRNYILHHLPNIYRQAESGTTLMVQRKLKPCAGSIRQSLC
jgi:hypothetical protein